MVLLLSDTLGNGERSLGETLLESYFTLLKEEPPAVIFTMNRGVLTLTGQSLSSIHLKELEELGVLILASKTCTDFHNVTHSLLLGRHSNIKEWVKLSNEFDVITLR